MRKIKCFIACAFGEKDVDKIYRESILKVLKELEIKPFRVDLVNHNEDINDKIIGLIKDCDFSIADLTYARPSVYYEAGFVEGLAKDVIFTVRKDHLGKTDKSENKVHFDLLTKNIISWEISTTSFENNLRDRIKLIITPIQRNLKDNELRKEKEERRKV